MTFLWLVAPAVFFALFVANSAWRDHRQEREAEIFRRSNGPREVVTTKNKNPYRGKESKKDSPKGARTVSSLPGSLARLIQDAGGGKPIGHYQLAPKIAFMSVMESDLFQTSDHQTITCALEEAGPTFVARPLPILEGARIPNTGIEFKKHADFMEQYLVQESESGPVQSSGPQKKTSPEVATKAIRRFLTRPLRNALLELPDIWLRVEGRAMAFTLYGRADADRMQHLLEIADLFFADYGADGGPSLLGEDDEDDDAAQSPYRANDDDQDAESDKEEQKDEKSADELRVKKQKKVPAAPPKVASGTKSTSDKSPSQKK